jgi:hypothetical protein
MNLAQRVRSLFARTTAVRKPLVRRFYPQLEGLTDRITPAVTASVAGGVLTVKAVGDAFDDKLTLGFSPFAGRFTVTGTNGTAVNTVANGIFDAVDVKSMKFDLGDGDDSVQGNFVFLAGGISFQGGNGANTFSLVNSVIGGSVAVTNLTNATGTDTTVLFGCTINGNITVNSGLGSTTGGFTNLITLGSLKYTTASSTLIPGDDAITFTRLNAGGSVSLALANGSNKLTSSINPFGVGGSFTYNGGSGTDTIDIPFGATFGTSATFNLGDNTNSINVTGNAALFVGTKLTVTAGAGNDSITLKTSVESYVHGAASFKLGDGNNTFVSDFLRVGSLGLTTGIGDDTGTFDNLIVAGAATLNFGGGTNTVNLASTAASSGASNIGGALTLTTGGGADTIKIGTATNGFCAVSGAAKFTLGSAAVGNGNDDLQIDSARFASSLSIVGGSGNDTLLIGNLTDVAIAGKLTVYANAGNDLLQLGLANDSNKLVRLLVAPVVNGGAGSDSLMFINDGNVQGPPGVVVLLTGPVLGKAGWEGIN